MSVYMGSCADDGRGNNQCAGGVSEEAGADGVTSAGARDAAVGPAGSCTGRFFRVLFPLWGSDAVEF